MSILLRFLGVGLLVGLSLSFPVPTMAQPTNGEGFQPKIEQGLAEASKRLSETAYFGCVMAAYFMNERLKSALDPKTLEPTTTLVEEFACENSNLTDAGFYDVQVRMSLNNQNADMRFEFAEWAGEAGTPETGQPSWLLARLVVEGREVHRRAGYTPIDEQ